MRKTVFAYIFEARWYFGTSGFNVLVATGTGSARHGFFVFLPSYVFNISPIRYVLSFSNRKSIKPYGLKAVNFEIDEHCFSFLNRVFYIFLVSMNVMNRWNRSVLTHVQSNKYCLNRKKLCFFLPKTNTRSSPSKRSKINPFATAYGRLSFTVYVTTVFNKNVLII